jgi:hypothetical protein
VRRAFFFYRAFYRASVPQLPRRAFALDDY